MWFEKYVSHLQLTLIKIVKWIVSLHSNKVERHYSQRKAELREKMFQFYGMDMSPPCSAVIVALNLAKVKFEYNTVDLIKGQHMKPEFLAINPNHTGWLRVWILSIVHTELAKIDSLFLHKILVPTVTDGDLTICESRAIIQYAFNRYAPDSEMYPSNPAERAKVDMLLYYDQGTFYKTVSKYIYNSLGIR